LTEASASINGARGNTEWLGLLNLSTLTVRTMWSVSWQ